EAGHHERRHQEPDRVDQQTYEEARHGGALRPSATVSPRVIVAGRRERRDRAFLEVPRTEAATAFVRLALASSRGVSDAAPGDGDDPTRAFCGASPCLYHWAPLELPLVRRDEITQPLRCRRGPRPRFDRALRLRQRPYAPAAGFGARRARGRRAQQPRAPADTKPRDASRARISRSLPAAEIRCR